MLHTLRATGGMVVAPHHLAAQAGLSVLREGGNAVEAMVAAAAAIAVVYPHMNGIGGDGFWLIAEPGRPPIGIDACGAAAAAATPDCTGPRATRSSRAGVRWRPIPWRGRLSGWGAALDCGAGLGGRKLPLSRLLEDAVHYARDGASVDRQPVALHGGEAGRAGRRSRLRPDLPAGRQGARPRQPVPPDRSGIDAGTDRDGRHGRLLPGRRWRGRWRRACNGRQPRGARRPGSAPRQTGRTAERPAAERRRSTT